MKDPHATPKHSRRQLIKNNCPALSRADEACSYRCGHRGCKSLWFLITPGYFHQGVPLQPDSCPPLPLSTWMWHSPLPIFNHSCQQLLCFPQETVSCVNSKKSVTSPTGAGPGQLTSSSAKWLRGATLSLQYRHLQSYFDLQFSWAGFILDRSSTEQNTFSQEAVKT